jgi:Zn-dependent protease
MFGRQFNSEQFLAGLIVFVIAITIHEFMHAFTAYQLGDNTAARQGRVTLNPVAHFDPLGFLMLIILLISPIGFAWGRPVPVNPGNFRNPKRGMLLVAAAGPLSNIVLATLLAVFLRFSGGTLDQFPPFVETLVHTGVRLNIFLAAFNMVPIPPLDGHKMLTGILPDYWYSILAPMEQYGFAILLALLFLPGFLGLNLVGPMVTPLAYLMANFLDVTSIVFPFR